MAAHTVYAVASGKGGVGKTATTVNLGASLAEAGYKVAIVDTDLGMANLGGFIGVEPEQTLHEVLAGEASLEEATYEALNGLAVVPSGISLNGFANVETAALADAVEALRDAFDYVLLDLGAGLSHDTVLPLALADAVILVSTPQPLSVQDTAKTRQITERLGGRVAGVVLTRAGDPADLGHEDVSDRLDLPVLAVIPEDDAVPASAREGQAIVQYDPDSPAVEGYRGLASIIEEESLANAPVVPEMPEPEPAAPSADAAATDRSEADAERAPQPTDGGAATGDQPAAGSDPGDGAPSAGSQPDPAADQTDTATTDQTDTATTDQTDTATTDQTDTATTDQTDGTAQEPGGGDAAAERTAEEIAAAIEDAAGDAEQSAADEPSAQQPPGQASPAEEPDATGEPGDPTDEAQATAGGEDAGGGEAGAPVDELFSDDDGEDTSVGDAGTAEGDDEEATLSVESQEDDDTEEGQAVDELFSVEGASPDEIDDEDEDEEEDSGGLLGGLFG